MNRLKVGNYAFLAQFLLLLVAYATSRSSSVRAFVSPSHLPRPSKPADTSIQRFLQLQPPVPRSVTLMHKGSVGGNEEVTDTGTKKSESAASGQNAFGVVTDAVTGVIFSLLHAFDDCDIKDSSKNLRVLWVRALLDYRNKIDDDVAMQLLPKTTRGLVTSEWGASLLDPILKFAEWIEARTDFIDTALDNFLSSPACRDAENDVNLSCNVVLFGAGYDTRALRYRHKHSENINFIEVDLPEVVQGKEKLYQQFQRENDPDWDFGSKHALVPFDLNDCGGAAPKNLIASLREQGGEYSCIYSRYMHDDIQP